MARDSPRITVLQLSEDEDVCHFWSFPHEPRDCDESFEWAVLQRLFGYLLRFHPAGRLRDILYLASSLFYSQI